MLRRKCFDKNASTKMLRWKFYWRAGAIGGVGQNNYLFYYYGAHIVRHCGLEELASDFLHMSPDGIKFKKSQAQNPCAIPCCSDSKSDLSWPTYTPPLLGRGFGALLKAFTFWSGVRFFRFEVVRGRGGATLPTPPPPSSLSEKE